MKNQALFSWKDNNKKKLKCRLLQFLSGDLRVNVKFLVPWNLRKYKTIASTLLEALKMNE